jgi:S-formylglutathione hydrolase
MTTLNISGEHACFGGTVSFHAHHSSACDAEMRFAVYVPPQAAEGPVPVLYYLAGLTSTEETFIVKGGAQRVAAEYGLEAVQPLTLRWHDGYDHSYYFIPTFMDDQVRHQAEALTGSA